MTKRIVATIAVLALGAGVAFAQQQQQVVGDGYTALVKSMEPSIDWWTILYFVVSGGALAAIGFKSSGRTHLD
jgi:hypothetical protein